MTVFPADPGMAVRPAGAFDPTRRRKVPPFHWLAFVALTGKELLRLRKLVAMIVLAPAFTGIVYFVCFRFGLAGRHDSADGQAVLDFMVPGLVMMSVLLQAAQNTGFSLMFSKIEGMVIDQLMAPIGARETVLAYAISGMVAGLAAGLGIALIMALFWPMEPRHPWALVVFSGLGALAMALLGFLFAMASAKWDHITAWFTFAAVPLVFFSGLFAPVESMPPVLAAVAGANPVFFAIDGFRYGYLGTHSAPLWLSATVLLGVSAVLYALAARLYSIGWRLKA